MTHVQLRCDYLVDQGVRCGEDPIGHKCGNVAAFERPDGSLICERCAALDPARLTLPALFGRAYQEEMIRASVADLLSRVCASESLLPAPDLDPRQPRLPNPARRTHVAGGLLAGVPRAVPPRCHPGG